MLDKIKTSNAYAYLALTLGIATAITLIHIYAPSHVIPFILPACLFAILLALIFYNLSTPGMLLPDFITLPGIIVGIICNAFLGSHHLQQAIGAIMVGFAMSLILNGIASKKGGIGFGTVKLLTMLASYFNIHLTIILILASIATSGIFLLIEYLYRKRVYIRTGPPVAAATVITYLWGNTIYKVLF